MSSKNETNLLNLERDLPVTPQDVEALRLARSHQEDDPFDALQLLVDALPAAARKPRLDTSEGWESFEL